MFEREGTCVNLWLILVDVWRKPARYCKAILFQLKKNFKKNSDKLSLDFPGDASGKEPTCHCRRHKRCGFDPWVGKVPWRRKRQPTPAFSPREFHGQRSLAGYGP